MKKLLITTMLTATCIFAANAKELKVTSPDGRLVVTLNDNRGIPVYSATYDGNEAIKPSRLGLITNVGATVTASATSRRATWNIVQMNSTQHTLTARTVRLQSHSAFRTTTSLSATPCLNGEKRQVSS